MAAYVEGEAPETDSEDEEFSLSISSRLKIKDPDNSRESLNATNPIKKITGSIVDGTFDFKSTSSSTKRGSEITEKYSPIYPHGPPKSEAEFFYENELFKKKINETASAAFRNYIQSELAPVSRQLIETDNSLINTQLTLQNATTTIKCVNDRYELINDRLINLIDCNFLSNVKRMPTEAETQSSS